MLCPLLIWNFSPDFDAFSFFNDFELSLEASVDTLEFSFSWNSLMIEAMLLKVTESCLSWTDECCIRGDVMRLVSLECYNIQDYGWMISDLNTLRFLGLSCLRLLTNWESMEWWDCGPGWFSCTNEALRADLLFELNDPALKHEWMLLDCDRLLLLMLFDFSL